MGSLLNKGFPKRHVCKSVHNVIDDIPCRSVGHCQWTSNRNIDAAILSLRTPDQNPDVEANLENFAHFPLAPLVGLILNRVRVSRGVVNGRCLKERRSCKTKMALL
jgi:hypothetical protein